MAKNSEILRAAKQQLDEVGLICAAISFSTIGGPIEKFSLKLWVMNLLAGADSYTSWVKIKHSDVYRKMTAKDMLEARHQWLDWMIQHWEEKENDKSR